MDKKVNNCPKKNRQNTSSNHSFDLKELLDQQKKI